MTTVNPQLDRLRVSESDYLWVRQLCPICDVRPAKFLGYRGGKAHRQSLGVKCEVWKCGNCGLRFPNPMPLPKCGLDQHYNIDPARYFASHDQDAKYAFAHDLLKIATKLVGKPGALLDVGTGRGEILRAARKNCWEAIGIEPSPTFCAYAAEYSGCQVLQKPIEDCDFALGSFDVVILSAILEHLYNPDATLRAISRVLRAGGVLYLEVPNEDGLFYRMGDFYHGLRRTGWSIHLSPTFPPYHVFGFGPRSLRMLLTKHQLQPTLWSVYGGGNVTPQLNGFLGKFEHIATSMAVMLSGIGSLGNYIEVWAVKS
jgi:SAM-dependent methyltransferase